MIAFVRAVMTRSIAAGAMVNVLGIDVDEYRRGAGIDNRGGGRNEGEGHGNHFVAWTNVRREQREMERARSRVDADGIGRSAVGRELPLERRDLFAEDELRAVQHTQNGFVDLRLDRAILASQIRVRESPRSHS